LQLPVLIAALLHDTLEDTATKPEEIKDNFGPEVLHLVQEVTDDKSLPKEMRKELQVKNAPHKSSGAKQIKLADKLSNIHDIITSPPANWSKERKIQYIDWVAMVFIGLKGTDSGLENELNMAITKARNILSPQ